MHTYFTPVFINAEGSKGMGIPRDSVEDVTSWLNRRQSKLIRPDIYQSYQQTIIMDEVVILNNNTNNTGISATPDKSSQNAG